MVVVITMIWTTVIIATVLNPALVALATLVTPVMLAPVGWIFAGDALRQWKAQPQETVDDPT